MKKTMISAAIASAMFTSVTAHAASTGPSLYGEVNLSGEYVSDQFDFTTGEEGSKKSLTSRNSFIGVKGAQGLDAAHGLDLVYDVQVGFDYSSSSDSEDFSLRKADIGVATDMFSVHAGKVANPYAALSQDIDMFSNSLASSRTIFESSYAEHLDNTVALYLTPVEGLTLAASYTHESSQDEDVFNVSGDTFDAYTLSAKYDMGIASVFGAFADFDFDDGITHSDTKYYKLGGEVAPMDNLALSLTGERMSWTGDSRTSYLAQAGYGVDPRITLKAGLGYIGSTNVTDSGNLYAVGVDYALGQNTTIGATYAYIDADTGADLDGYNTLVSDSNKGFSVALNHRF